MNEVKGYKVFDSDWKCLGFQYEVGNTFKEELPPKRCERGFHFCLDIADCFNYYQFEPSNKVAEVTALGDIDYDDDDSKCATNIIRIDRELTWHEVLDLVNKGKGNTGILNNGNKNTGRGNNGHGNTGCYNGGNRNTGDYNSGLLNTGDNNLGDLNTGHDNTGHRNVGNFNSGNFNVGDFNSGSGNVGDFNIGYYCIGCFNTKEQKIKLFDKETNMTMSEWYASDAYFLLRTIGRYQHEWINAENMTFFEKEDHPEHKEIDGYNKIHDFSYGAERWWKSLDLDEKSIIKNIPNFDAKKFKEITGIDVSLDDNTERIDE